MRLAISNIAWDREEDDIITLLLQAEGFDAIDVAPSKYFTDPHNISAIDIADIKAWWKRRGIDIIGMQALLFGTQGLNLFGNHATQDAMLQHLSAICRIGERLGASRLVFGSPKNRDRSGLSDDETLAKAVDFFKRLGDIALNAGVVICLEPNPAAYGCNFMTHTLETAQVVKHVNHPAIAMQCDTGALTMNGEDPEIFLKNHAALIGHIHASEPQLLPLGDGPCDHVKMAKAIKKHLPGQVVTIEMLATRDEPHADAIARALAAAKRYYT